MSISSQVVATDGGSPRLSSTATVRIYVKDEETNPPTFPISFYNFSVPESAPVGKCFAGVVAEDPDCGINAKLSYVIPDPTTASSFPRVSYESCTSILGIDKKQTSKQVH